MKETKEGKKSQQEYYKSHLVEHGHARPSTHPIKSAKSLFKQLFYSEILFLSIWCQLIY